MSKRDKTYKSQKSNVMHLGEAKYDYEKGLKSKERSEHYTK